MITQDDIDTFKEYNEQDNQQEEVNNGTFFSTKTYGHNIGLSAVFRQPHADSHCRFLHGYSLQFKFVFGARELDHKNWAVDFGGLKPLKAWLEDHFDHKTIIDINDPHLEDFKNLQKLGLAELTIFDGVGAEMFAYHAWNFADKLIREATNNRCWCESAECAEHGANSAIFTPTSQQHTKRSIHGI